MGRYERHEQGNRKGSKERQIRIEASSPYFPQGSLLFAESCSQESKTNEKFKTEFLHSVH